MGWRAIAGQQHALMGVDVAVVHAEYERSSVEQDVTAVVSEVAELDARGSDPTLLFQRGLPRHADPGDLFRYGGPAGIQVVEAACRRVRLRRRIPVSRSS